MQGELEAMMLTKALKISVVEDTREQYQWRHQEFFDKNSLEKLNFYLFFENLLLIIEPSEITSFFYNNSFNFGGGDVPCVPRWRPLCV